MDRITISAFRAVEDPERCGVFLREHQRVLEDFGITNVRSNNATWLNDPEVIVLVVEHETLGMVGGGRLHVSRSEQTRLPIEGAVAALDPRITPMLSDLAVRGGVAEICGLWNANRFSGRSMPHLLVMTGIAMAGQIGVGAVIGLAAKYTLRYTAKFGMHVFEQVGNNGWFNYPKPGFYGIVTGVLDSFTLERARPDMRTRMLSLRLRPEQQAIEDTGTAVLDIQYHLRLKRSVISMEAYNSIQFDRLRYSA
jgi:hypothetical protein